MQRDKKLMRHYFLFVVVVIMTAIMIKKNKLFVSTSIWFAASVLGLVLGSACFIAPLSLYVLRIFMFFFCLTFFFVFMLFGNGVSTALVVFHCRQELGLRGLGLI